MNKKQIEECLEEYEACKTGTCNPEELADELYGILSEPRTKPEKSGYTNDEEY